jgi:hypothetical protein
MGKSCRNNSICDVFNVIDASNRANPFRLAQQGSFVDFSGPSEDKEN